MTLPIRARLVSLLLLASCAGCWDAHGRAVEPPPPAPDAGLPIVDGGPTPVCDDHDPCTVDRLTADECRHAPAPDGTSCDDEDPCTRADRCTAGRCEGLAGAEGPPALISSTFPRYHGNGTAVGDDRFLFARHDDVNELFLVHVSADGFTVLDRAETEAPVHRVESLGPDLAVVAMGDTAQLVDLTADRLRLRGTFALGGRMVEVAFAGDRLYACVALDWIDRALYELDATDLDAPTRMDRHPILCDSVVASSDRQRAYAADYSSHVSRLTPQPGGHSRVETLPLEAASLHAGRGYLTLTKANGVSVVRERDLSLVGSVSGRVSNARVTARGLEIYGSVPPQPSSQTSLTVFEVREGASPALVERSHELLDASATPPVAVWVSHDDGLRWRSERLYSLTGAGAAPYLTRVDDPDTAWPGGVVIDGSTIHLRDGVRSVEIDASDPRRPRSVGGGDHDGDYAVAVDVSVPARPALLGDYYRPAVMNAVDLAFPPLYLPPVELVSRRFVSSRHAEDAARHDLGLAADRSRLERLDLRDGALLLSTWASADATALRLRRWPVEALAHAPLAPPALDIEAPLDGFPELARVHDATATAFAVNIADPATQEYASEIHWVPLAPGAPPVAPLELPWRVVDLAVRGERVMIVATHSTERTSLHHGALFVAAERRGDALVEVGRLTWEDDRYPLLRRALAFDGRFFYVQLPEGVAGADDGAVLGLRFEQLDAPHAVYPVPTSVQLQSFEETDYGLVMAHRDALFIARPWCE